MFNSDQSWCQVHGAMYKNFCKVANTSIGSKTQEQVLKKIASTSTFTVFIPII